MAEELPNGDGEAMPPVFVGAPKGEAGGFPNAEVAPIPPPLLPDENGEAELVVVPAPPLENGDAELVLVLGPALDENGDCAVAALPKPEDATGIELNGAGVALWAPSNGLGTLYLLASFWNI